MRLRPSSQCLAEYQNWSIFAIYLSVDNLRIYFRKKRSFGCFDCINEYLSGGTSETNKYGAERHRETEMVQAYIWERARVCNIFFKRIEILLRSTMKKENQQEGRGCTYMGVYNLVEEHLRQGNNLGISECAQMLIGLQSQLNQQLTLNAILTEELLKQADLEKMKSSSSTNNHSKSLQQNQIKVPPPSISPYKKNPASNKSKKPPISEDSDYIPNDSDSNVVTRYKLSESKNIPKNYGKSILAYIRKKEAKTTRVLAHLKIDQFQFQEWLGKFKNNINTIADLRSLWLDENDSYAKAMRILSMEYVRRHSFSHIFNSRVENYKKHIKYRYKILQGLERPGQFTQMKDF